jgi:hypothetical protein
MWMLKATASAGFGAARLDDRFHESCHKRGIHLRLSDS